MVGTGRGGNIESKGDGRWTRETGIFVFGRGGGWIVEEKSQDEVAVATYKGVGILEQQRMRIGANALLVPARRGFFSSGAVGGKAWIGFSGKWMIEKKNPFPFLRLLFSEHTKERYFKEKACSSISLLLWGLRVGLMYTYIAE